MNRILQTTLISSLMVATLGTMTLIPSQRAAADPHIIRDIGIGAGANVLSGGIRGHGSVLHNAVKGAAAGTAVNLVNSTRSPYHQKHRNLGQDVGVGAAASTATGAIFYHHRHVLGDAVDGAASGAAIHFLTNGK